MPSAVQQENETLTQRQVENAQPAHGLRSHPLLQLVSFPVMLGCLLVGAIFGATLGFRLDPDVWWHIKVGETILKTHHWPTVDPFSFTAAHTPWIAYEWFGEIILALTMRVGGLQGLEAFQVVVAGSILVSLYVLGTLRSGNSKAGFVAAAVLLIFANTSFSVRPQMLGYLFLVLTLIILEMFRQGRTLPLWFLPPLFLLWVNTHGSFIIGIGTVGLYLLAGLFEFRFGGIEATAWSPAQRRQLETALLFSLAALVITPYGAEVAVYPFDMAFNQPINVANILEWQPMPFAQLGGKLFLALVLGFVAAQTAFRFTWRLHEFLLALAGIGMATLHLRFVLLFVPFFAPVLAEMLARWVPGYDRNKDKYALNAVLIIGLIAAVAHYFPSRTQLQEKVTGSFPVGAVKYLQSHDVPEPMFNTYGYGGYLIWSLNGQHKVFIDGRADIYERVGVLADYLSIARPAPLVFHLLQSYNVQSCLLDRDESLVAALSASPDWQKRYQDSLSVLFVRRQSEPK